MGYNMQEMNIGYYDQVYILWKNSKGVRLSEIDSRDNIARLLERNPGLSFVALDGDTVVGAVLCSHDGRIAYLTHLAVNKEYRRQGIGRSLVGRCLYTLMSIGINRCALLVMEDHSGARSFWERMGASGRVEMVMMSPYKT